jgi:hypothetical protein
MGPPVPYVNKHPPVIESPPAVEKEKEKEQKK